eukprot:2730575-Amphidinium_carterae.1
MPGRLKRTRCPSGRKTSRVTKVTRPKPRTGRRLDQEGPGQGCHMLGNVLHKVKETLRSRRGQRAHNAPNVRAPQHILTQCPAI